MDGVAAELSKIVRDGTFTDILLALQALNIVQLLGQHSDRINGYSFAFAFGMFRSKRLMLSFWQSQGCWGASGKTIRGLKARSAVVEPISSNAELDRTYTRLLRASRDRQCGRPNPS
jgi:hypothetical protein